MTRPALDPRRHAYRADLAAKTLRGRVSAPRFVAGEVRRVVHPAAPLFARRDPREGWASEVLYGELVTVYEKKGGWAWVQVARDGYVGYVRAAALAAPARPATHRVQVPGTFLYAAPEAGARTGLHLSLNSPVCAEEPATPFAKLADGGFVPMRHLAEPDAFAPDFVAVAERFVGTPYIWGGRTRLGIDCSGLVQTALHAAGRDCPRDSDMQMAELGRAVPVPADLGGLQRGDLVFWKGHVGILTDPATLLHATATFMAVIYEPLARAVDRIARNGSVIAAIRRIAPKSG